MSKTINILYYLYVTCPFKPFFLSIIAAPFTYLGV